MYTDIHIHTIYKKNIAHCRGNSLSPGIRVQRPRWERTAMYVYVYLSIYLSIHISVCLSIYLDLHICMSIYMNIQIHTYNIAPGLENRLVARYLSAMFQRERSATYIYIYIYVSKQKYTIAPCLENRLFSKYLSVTPPEEAFRYI